jgi:hypothetical protein
MPAKPETGQTILNYFLGGAQRRPGRAPPTGREHFRWRLSAESRYAARKLFHLGDDGLFDGPPGAKTGQTILNYFTFSTTSISIGCNASIYFLKGISG